MPNSRPAIARMTAPIKPMTHFTILNSPWRPRDALLGGERLQVRLGGELVEVSTGRRAKLLRVGLSLLALDPGSFEGARSGQGVEGGYGHVEPPVRHPILLPIDPTSPDFEGRCKRSESRTMSAARIESRFSPDRCHGSAWCAKAYSRISSALDAIASILLLKKSKQIYLSTDSFAMNDRKHGRRTDAEAAELRPLPGGISSGSRR